MFRIFVCITTIFVFYRFTVNAQPVQFRSYKDAVHKFTFDIPVYWTIKYSKEQEGVICIPVTKAQKDIFKDCYEGIVFRMELLNYGLDSLLSAEYVRDGNNYITSDRISEKVPVNFIKGNGWKGIFHDNTCGINCLDNGFHAAAGECQFIYFSNGKQTIGINTNGRAFDKKILDRIISSFRFTK